MTKKSRQKFKYLENEKSFKVKQKAFFIIFQGFSIAKNCLRLESAPLKKRIVYLHIHVTSSYLPNLTSASIYVLN